MAWTIFDYVDAAGNNLIKAWGDELEVEVRARLNQKIDMLQRHGADLAPKLLAGTRIATIDKLRVNGRVAARLMLCRGPIDMRAEFTLLVGAIEKDRKLIPRDAEKVAAVRRADVLGNRARRVPHVRFR